MESITDPVGTTSIERARWLMSQLPSSRPTGDLPPLGKVAKRSEWETFLNREGVPQDAAKRLAKERKRWLNGIYEALERLRASALTASYPFQVEREWKLSGGKITATLTPSESVGFVVNIVMDCLARHCRICQKEKCKELSTAKGMKSYCSPKEGLINSRFYSEIYF